MNKIKSIVVLIIFSCCCCACSTKIYSPANALTKKKYKKIYKNADGVPGNTTSESTLITNYKNISYIFITTKNGKSTIVHQVSNNTDDVLDIDENMVSQSPAIWTSAVCDDINKTSLSKSFSTVRVVYLKHQKTTSQEATFYRALLITANASFPSSSKMIPLGNTGIISPNINAINYTSDEIPFNPSIADTIYAIDENTGLLIPIPPGENKNKPITQTPLNASAKKDSAKINSSKADTTISIPITCSENDFTILLGLNKDGRGTVMVTAKNVKTKSGKNVSNSVVKSDTSFDFWPFHESDFMIFLNENSQINSADCKAYIARSVTDKVNQLNAAAIASKAASSAKSDSASKAKMATNIILQGKEPLFIEDLDSLLSKKNSNKNKIDSFEITDDSVFSLQILNPNNDSIIKTITFTDQTGTISNITTDITQHYQSFSLHGRDFIAVNMNACSVKDTAEAKIKDSTYKIQLVFYKTDDVKTPSFIIFSLIKSIAGSIPKSELLDIYLKVNYTKNKHWFSMLGVDAGINDSTGGTIQLNEAIVNANYAAFNKTKVNTLSRVFFVGGGLKVFNQVPYLGGHFGSMEINGDMLGSYLLCGYYYSPFEYGLKSYTAADSAFRNNFYIEAGLNAFGDNVPSILKSVRFKFGLLLPVAIHGADKQGDQIVPTTGNIFYRLAIEAPLGGPHKF